MSEGREAAEVSRAAHRDRRLVLTIRKAHSLTGVVPLGVFLVYHAWQQSPVRLGRDALLARLNDTSHGLVETLAVLLPLVVHAACGLWLSRRESASRVTPAVPSASYGAPAVYASPAFRRFQAITGLVMALFLALHVGGTWRPWLVAGRAFVAYGALLDQTGTLPGAAAYVVGISATCVHFGQGLSAFVLRWWPESPPLFARGLGTLLGLGLWLILIDELAVYATGATLM